MSIAYQATALKDLLEAWAQPKGGVAKVASNLKDMWAQASQSSQKPIVLVCYTGENVRGPFATGAVCHRVDRQWTVAVVRGRGFAPVRGSTLTESIGNVEPFYDSVEAVRELIRNARELTAEPPIDYKSVRPMQLGTLIIDGYLIEFSTAVDLTQVTNTKN